VFCKCWLAVLISLAAFTQSKTQSILDGVFTVEQATRGQRLYAEACTSCHRDDLSGNEDGAPPLRGDAFLGRWRDRWLSEFSFVLTETMPQDAPGSLTPKQYADIISFILKNNGAPAGRMELPEDAESLGRIRFARTGG
jgi:mono/diheme cytochrome c family protein